MSNDPKEQAFWREATPQQLMMLTQINELGQRIQETIKAIQNKDQIIAEKDRRINDLQQQIELLTHQDAADPEDRP